MKKIVLILFILLLSSSSFLALNAQDFDVYKADAPPGYVNILDMV